MEATDLELGSLTAFENVAAGHEGVLTDPSGDLVIKPCTQSEVDFYQETVANHVEFAALMPTFMGTLQLGKTKQLEETLQTANATNDQPILVPATDDSQNATDGHRGVVATTRGKALDTELAIVLENIAAGFTRPNILDVKLGKRLWADDAPLAKRTKFDRIASETTTGSLGFRVAGMKIWEQDDYRIYDKWYGRSRTVDNVQEAFEELFDVAADDGDTGVFEEVVEGILEAVEEVEQAISGEETRMYSSSLLFVYEGDRKARKEALESAYSNAKAQDSVTSIPALVDDGVDDDDDDDDFEQSSNKKIFDIRVIDFAHAAWTPGQGPDKNMLLGIHSILDILQKMTNREKEGRK